MKLAPSKPGLWASGTEGLSAGWRPHQATVGQGPSPTPKPGTGHLGGPPVLIRGALDRGLRSSTQILRVAAKCLEGRIASGPGSAPELLCGLMPLTPFLGFLTAGPRW